LGAPELGDVPPPSVEFPQNGKPENYIRLINMAKSPASNTNKLDCLHSLS
jgi:hypothetical protein